MTPDDTATPWRKSSYSNSQANCVQLTQTHTGKIAIRDSKHPHGGTLTLSTRAWQTFLANVQATASDLT